MNKQAQQPKTLTLTLEGQTFTYIKRRKVVDGPYQCMVVSFRITEYEKPQDALVEWTPELAKTLTDAEWFKLAAERFVYLAKKAKAQHFYIPPEKVTKWWGPWYEPFVK